MYLGRMRHSRCMIWEATRLEERGRKMQPVCCRMDLDALDWGLGEKTLMQGCMRSA